MDYSELVSVYEYLEKTSSRLKKTEAIADLLKKTETGLLPKIVLLLQGRVFSSWSEKEIGIASKTAAKIISTSTGFSGEQVMKAFRKTGDFGLVIEEFAKKKKQSTLFRKHLIIEHVFDNIQKLASVEGKGSQDRKYGLVSELIASARPSEAKYIIRTVLGDLRVGVAHGIMRDAIAKAFLSGKNQKDETSAVEWAWFLRPDYGEIAAIAKTKGISGLKKVKLMIGKPYHVLLAERSKGLKDALGKFDRPALEFKYDGARIIVHKKGSDVWLFTRRLENITRQFPDVVKLVKECVKAKECIIEGEMLAIDKKTGKPMQFQALSQRIKRKYDIEKTVSDIPVEIDVFDIVYLDGRSLFEETLEKRRKHLAGIIKSKKEFSLAEQLVTKDFKKAESFYNQALAAGQEGLIVKNLDASYQPGRRVGYWLKVKPVMENLDLAIIGATWGTGKRVGSFGSFVLGCRRGDHFVECGMIGTGIKEKVDKKTEEGVTFKQLTGLLKPHIESQSGNQAKIRPKVIVEVAYEEIQKSPNYESGFALRFPRVLRLRSDRSVQDADSVERIEKLYEQQRGGARR
jgi:DNA ligase-1